MRHYYVANVAFRGILTSLVECDKGDTVMSFFPGRSNSQQSPLEHVAFLHVIAVR